MYQNIEFQEKLSIWTQLISGNVAGWCSITIAQPLDLLKTKCQLNQSITINTISSMIKQKGIFSFYRGASSVYAFVGLVTAIQFAVFQFIKSIQKNTFLFNIKNDSKQELLLSGGLTGLLSSFIYTPIEYTKIHTQMDNKPQSSFSRIFAIIYNEKFKGVKKLYTGNILTLIKQVPGSAIYFGGFHIYLQSISKKKRHQAYLIEQVQASALAAASYVLYAYPLDTIKTNIQSGKHNLKQLITQKFWQKQSFKLGFKISFLRGLMIDITALTVYENVRNYITKKQLF